MGGRVEFASDVWTAGVVGLGYVGLPLAVAASEAGLNVVGFDVSDARVDELNAGHGRSVDISDERLRAVLDGGARFTTDSAALGECDAIFICVPSPLGRNREPDLSFIERAVGSVVAAARPGVLVALESTTYPGTTEDLVVPPFLEKGFVLDESVFVAFSSERVSPGDGTPHRAIPKIVGGVTDRSGTVAGAAYERLFADVRVVSSAGVAELSKLLENTYRSVNIGLINEMAQLAHEIDVDIWEVVDAAATKPFGFQAFYPGPGVGGHCIPLDPQYLAWRARESRFATRFIDAAEQVNTAMPAYVANRAIELLNDRSVPARGARVLGVGIAYKPNVPDDRESAALDVLAELERWGADVTVLDPYFDREWIEGRGFDAVAELEGSSFDLAIVLTDHDVFDFAAIAGTAPVVFDTRNAFRRRGLDLDNVVVL